MDAAFKVEYLDERPTIALSNGHYSAGWRKGRYYAENLRVELNTPEGSTEYISSYHTLDGVVAEAEMNILFTADCGMAAIYDGKYRVAVVTKKYHNDFADRNYTDYGKTCYSKEAN